MIIKCCFLIAIFFSTCSLLAENRRPKVVVVGAGLAGLTTAYRLQQKGVDVEVYEARNRVGGRVLTAKIGSYLAELGGQNINDGGESKNIRRLIQEFGFELEGHKVYLNFFYFDGEKFFSQQQILRKKKFHFEELKARLDDLVPRSQNMREVLNGILDEKDPLNKMLAIRLAGYEGAAPEKLSPIYSETLYYMLLGGISAAHRGNGVNGNYITIESIKGGNSLLLEKIAQALGRKIHLNMPLKKVSKNKDHSYLLTFQNHQKVKADLLVLAIPCSVYEDILFEENTIPSQRLEAIKRVQYGTNAKIIIPFNKLPVKRKGLLNDHMGCFFDADRKILSLYYTGSAAKFFPETIVQTYLKDRPMLEKGFGESCPSFIPPLFANDHSFSSYEGPVGYSWPNDPYAKGSYSYIAPGQEMLMTSLQEERGVQVKTLYAPIDQTLYFAGEHASILLDVPGTMEAACESGERAAGMILDLMPELSLLRNS